MYLNTFNIPVILESIGKFRQDDNDIFLLMIAENTDYDIPAFLREINNNAIKVVGGIFPAIIYKNKKCDTGVIVKRFVSQTTPFLIKGLDGNDFELPEFNVKQMHEASSKPTALVLVDGLTANTASFLKRLYHDLGNTTNYIGGGAGSLSLKQQECVFSNEGIFQDAAIVTILDWNADLGVNHGWKNVYGPLLVTKSDKNVIKELNWENPFDVYKNLIKQDSGMLITEENFFSVAKNYPFGISKEDSEFVVRDPISVNSEGELICVGEVSENTVLVLLKGEHKLLVEAAVKAAESAIVSNKNYKSALIMDCISRTLFMEDDFVDELNGIQGALDKNNISLDIEGALSLGEISSDGQGFLEFFNKTILVSLFYEK